MFDVISLWFFLGLIAFIAGIYSRVSAMSFGLVLTVGLYSVKNLFPNNILYSELLPIILATSLAASVPINLFYLIQSSRHDRIDMDVVAKRATGASLIAIITAQLIGIFSIYYLQMIFTFTLVLYSVYYFAPKLMQIKLNVIKIPYKIQSILLGLLPVISGNEGKELSIIFANSAAHSTKTASTELNNTLNVSKEFEKKTLFGTSSTIGLFVALSACIGFSFPAFPLENSLYKEYIGYIHLPVAMYLSVIGAVGIYTVRNHDSEIDSIWLQKTFAIFLLGVLLRDIYLLVAI